jgi:hypothetical protein
MYETLAAGAAFRTVTSRDLNIPDPPEGADPQMAAGFHPLPPSAVPLATPASSSPATGWMALDVHAVHDAVLAGWTPSRAVTRTPAQAGPGVRGWFLPVSGQSRTPVLQAASLDSVLGAMGALASLLDPDGEKTPAKIARAGKERG